MTTNKPYYYINFCNAIFCSKAFTVGVHYIRFFMQARKTNLKGKNISDNQAGFIAHIRLREMAVFATPLSFIFRGWVSSCKRVITTNDLSLTQF
jgi:hypothetical protein